MDTQGEYNNPIKVSVFIGTYNQEEYIKDALEGALNQKTDFDYEILVHDDASTDNTERIIREYEQQYPDKIVGFYEEVNSYSHFWDAANRMLERAKGKYVAMFDGDDYWTDENKLQMQYDFMESHPDYALCVHNTRCIDLKTGESGLYNTEHKTGELPQGYVIERACAVFSSSSHFFRLQEWRDKHDGRDMYDLAKVCYLADQGKIMYFDNVMSVYRVHTKGSWSNSMSDNYNLISDYMGRLSFYKKFDRETEYRWHENVEKIMTGIEAATCGCTREFYRKFKFKHRFALLLGWAVDCFGLYPLRTWIRQHIGI